MQRDKSAKRDVIFLLEANYFNVSHFLRKEHLRSTNSRPFIIQNDSDILLKRHLMRRYTHILKSN